MKYIALEDVRFDWDEEEVKRFDQLWKEGKSIFDLAKIFKRTQIEMALLIMDRHKKGYIKRRENGLLGEWNR